MVYRSGPVHHPIKVDGLWMQPANDSRQLIGWPTIQQMVLSVVASRWIAGTISQRMTAPGRRLPQNRQILIFNFCLILNEFKMSNPLAYYFWIKYFFLNKRLTHATFHFGSAWKWAAHREGRPWLRESYESRRQLFVYSRSFFFLTSVEIIIFE